MSNFQNQNFILKTCLSCAVLPQDSTNVIYFYVRQFEMPKIAFQKVTSSHFLFYHCTAKYKDIALKFGVLFVCSFTTRIPFFFITPKFWYL